MVALIDAQCPLAPGQVLSLQSAALAELALNGLRASARGTIRQGDDLQRVRVMLASEQSVGAIVYGLTGVAADHGLQRRRALEIRVKAVVQGVPGVHRRPAPSDPRLRDL